jgi:hypothetical protein
MVINCQELYSMKINELMRYTKSDAEAGKILYLDLAPAFELLLGTLLF